jgi:hypothetical protein
VPVVLETQVILELRVTLEQMVTLVLEAIRVTPGGLVTQVRQEMLALLVIPVLVGAQEIQEQRAIQVIQVLRAIQVIMRLCKMLMRL